MVKQSVLPFPLGQVFWGFTFPFCAGDCWFSPFCLHAAGYAEGSADGGEYSDNHLQDSFPNFLFHFLFPFFFSGSTFRKRLGRCAPLSFSPSVF